MAGPNYPNYGLSPVWAELGPAQPQLVLFFFLHQKLHQLTIVPEMKLDLMEFLEIKSFKMVWKKIFECYAASQLVFCGCLNAPVGAHLFFNCL